MIGIKICGITNIEDALACSELGADFIGFIFAESPRQINLERAISIREFLPKSVRTVGVFTNESDAALEAIDRGIIDLAQLHGDQSEEFAKKIGSENVIRAGRIQDAGSVWELSQHRHAAYYLLDTYNKDKAGGTGETFDWSLAAAAKEFGTPIFLAGGLNPDNVTAAIEIVQPYAVDTSSGVEHSPGRKDYNKVKEFIDNVRKCDNAA